MRGRKREVNDRAVSVLENYELEVLRTLKGRGSLVCETDRGWIILKEYTGPAARLEVEEKLLEGIRENGFLQVEQLLRNKEGMLLTYDQDHVPYIVKTWFEGRECNLRDMKECRTAAGTLGQLHKAMCMPGIVEEYEVPVLALESEYAKHNRELKKVRRFLREKSQKTEFEIYLLHYYDYFYEKALRVMEELAASGQPDEGRRSIQTGSFCHGEFQYHNLLWQSGSFCVINFEKYALDNQVRDLYLFLRKLLEKNEWSVDVGMEILDAYEEQRTLTESDRLSLYYRFAYPEKFWKIVNYYYNKGKSWIPEKNREKLENILCQEDQKARFLQELISKNTQ